MHSWTDYAALKRLYFYIFKVSKENVGKIFDEISDVEKYISLVKDVLNEKT